MLSKFSNERSNFSNSGKLEMKCFLETSKLIKNKQGLSLCSVKALKSAAAATATATLSSFYRNIAATCLIVSTIRAVVFAATAEAAE